ncbi:MAG: DUF1330 domain-containing protein [Pseudomonadales bacterium]|nr:DUF1330 domain-containing protein [Pseudomonadales bacterium]
MTKPAYMIIGVDIHDANIFERYAEGAVPLLPQLGATILSAANDIECLRGNWTPDRLVVLKFRSLEVAHAFYNSSEYAPYKTMRESCSDSDIMLVEGLADEDPGSEAEHNVLSHFLLGFNDPLNTDWVEEYQAKVPPIAKKYGLVVPCVGDNFEVLHGSFKRQSVILLQFPSFDAYRGFWTDPDYLPIKKLREDNTDSEHVAFPSGFSAV